MKRSLALLGILGLLGACGGRSTVRGYPGDGGASNERRPTVGDGLSLRDGTGPNTDRAVIIHDDVFPRRDLRPADACLPVPAGQVAGGYQGSWKGSWKCPGGPPNQVSGSLELFLAPAGSPNAFAVKGSMKGTVNPGIPFAGEIEGTMSCTVFSAAMPSILVGSGAMMTQLAGTMNGAFTSQPGQTEFEVGSWQAKEKNGPCQASGTWQAWR